ncbi:MAG: polyketide cyclase [Candidatus Dormibacteria bacterium]
MTALASETVSASIIIKAAADAIFAVLADPAKHAAIDGTGWVCDPIDRQALAASGQVFRMAMYHPDHTNSNGNYEIANRVQVFDSPRAISWEPGYDPGDGNLRFGGWIWRYDLAPLGPSETEVTLSYDWSAVADEVRSTGLHFPPFGSDHLDNSLTHLAHLVAA